MERHTGMGEPLIDAMNERYGAWPLGIYGLP